VSTIKDIAQKAGVSISTVSYALNGIPKVHPETRDRILALAKELGYYPNTQARNLKMGSTRRIGVFTNELGGSCLGAIMRGIQEALTGYDFDVLVATVNRNYKERAYSLLRERWLDAAIMHNSADIDIDLLQTASQICPLVLMDREPDDVKGIENICTLTIDNYHGAAELTRRLVKMGRKKFMFLGGVHESYDNQKRFEGFRDVLREAGIVFDPSWYFECNFYESVAFSKMTEILKAGMIPDALFCANDEMAIGALLALNEHGLRVPQDVSVTGFDDNEFARHSSPPLTTVSYDRVGMGSKAVHALMKMLQGTSDNKSIIIPTTLVIRNSCGSISNK